MPRATYGSSAEVKLDGGFQAEMLDRITDGKHAAATLAFLQAPILELREQTITHLINSYRAGKTEHDRLVGAVAELTALDNIIRRMENLQRQGEISAEMEFKNG